MAISSLLANKFRTFLAMLGIIIGVAAVIAMLAIGAGARHQIMDRINSFGANFLQISPQHSEENGAVTEDVVPTLTVSDAEAIINEVEHVVSVSPVVNNWGLCKFGSRNFGATVYGVSPPYFDIRNFILEKGDFFTDLEDDHGGCVAVIGADVAEKIFPPEIDSIGKTMKIDERNFKVIGQLKRKGGWGNDNVVMIPNTVSMKKVNAVTSLNEIDVKIDAPENLDKVTAQIVTLLRRRHKLRATRSNDFHIRSQEAILEMVQGSNKVFEILLASVAGISLLVGGIGIMNIMMVTVRERTKEIGIRKAVGARNRDVLRQFLLESIMMCTIGGLLGVGFGCGASYAIGHYFKEFKTVIEMYSVLLSLGVASSVGIFFGWYPASRAAKLDTIEALRYE